jgi:hypothetical protein
MANHSALRRVLSITLSAVTLTGVSLVALSGPAQAACNAWVEAPRTGVAWCNNAGYRYYAIARCNENDGNIYFASGPVVRAPNYSRAYCHEYAYADDAFIEFA